MYLLDCRYCVYFVSFYCSEWSRMVTGRPTYIVHQLRGLKSHLMETVCYKIQIQIQHTGIQGMPCSYL